MSALRDNMILAKILKMLVTPFSETDAFKLGIIDADGNNLRKPESAKEKSAYSYLDKFVFNLKKILNKRNPKSTKDMAHAMFLVKESTLLDEAMISDVSESEIEDLLFILDESEIDISALEEEIASTAITAAAPKDNPIKFSKLKKKLIARNGDKL